MPSEKSPQLGVLLSLSSCRHASFARASKQGRGPAEVGDVKPSSVGSTGKLCACVCVCPFPSLPGRVCSVSQGGGKERPRRTARFHSSSESDRVDPVISPGKLPSHAVLHPGGLEASVSLKSGWEGCLPGS